jgi:hypothetical protein
MRPSPRQEKQGSPSDFPDCSPSLNPRASSCGREHFSPLSRIVPRAGLVTLRQSFVRRRPERGFSRRKVPDRSPGPSSGFWAYVVEARDRESIYPPSPWRGAGGMHRNAASGPCSLALGLARCSAFQRSLVEEVTASCLVSDALSL